MNNKRFQERLAKLLTFWIFYKPWRKKIERIVIGRKNYHKEQDEALTEDIKSCKNLIVFIIPETNRMSGGIYSFFSLAKASRKFENLHNSIVLLMTRPNEANDSYIKQTNFRNNEIVYRFEQIIQFKNLENLIIHIPEFASKNFYELLPAKIKQHLSQISNLRINILNQNIDLMPTKKHFKNLYKFTNNITQTIAHERYTTQEYCNKFQLPTLLLPAYTDLEPYEKLEFSKKEDIIVYSPDKNNNKQEILNKIASKLPKFKLVEIKDITFDEYMDIVTRAKFGITFGEGYDGYLAQPIYQGGLSFAVYNDEYFPSSEYKELENIFSSYDDMKKNIISRIKDFDNNKEKYEKARKGYITKSTKTYNYKNYLKSIEKFYLGKVDFTPDKEGAICK